MIQTPADRPARLAVGVVGFGRVGGALGVALGRAGHRVVAVSGVTDATWRRADRLLPGVPVLPAAEVAAQAELLLVTTPDDVLADVVATLAAQGAFRAGQIVLHTSGRHGLEVLEPVRAAGALPLALHPVMTFAGGAEDADRIPGAVFGVSAPEPLRAVAEALVVEMGGEPVWVPDDARGRYHAALAWSANYLVTLVASAQDLLAGAGVGEPSRLLAPLLGAALDNALRRGDNALTGPVARGDSGTVAAHLEELRRSAPELVPAYLALARLTADRALAAGLLDAAAAEPLLGVLADEGARS